jgi:hypothetical protein
MMAKDTEASRSLGLTVICGRLGVSSAWRLGSLGPILTITYKGRQMQSSAAAARSHSEQITPEHEASPDSPVKRGDQLVWQGRDVQVQNVVVLASGWTQVVLQFLDQADALPVSVPLTDLEGCI